MEKNLPNFDKFFELVEDQFRYGGKKYAHSDQRESTDVLFDDFGKNWLLGTIAKYIKRYSNLARERDLLKIACYMFIFWLKRGFHIDDKRIAPIDTTVEVKLKYFPEFKKRQLYYSNRKVKFITDEELRNTVFTEAGSISYCMNAIYKELKGLAIGSFTDINELNLFNIFNRAYIVWNRDIKEKGQDKDTWNEQGKETKGGNGKG